MVGILFDFCNMVIVGFVLVILLLIFYLMVGGVIDMVFW